MGLLIGLYSSFFNYEISFVGSEKKKAKKLSSTGFRRFRKKEHNTPLYHTISSMTPYSIAG